MYFHHQQGIEIKSPVQWPYNKGLSFCCWLRVESFPEKGMMGLFSFFTENGKGCLAMLGKNALIYEVIFASCLRSLFILFCYSSSFITYGLSSAQKIFCRVETVSNANNYPLHSKFLVVFYFSKYIDFAMHLDII